MTTGNYSKKEDGRPSQQWYWDDWFSEFGLRLCSLAARGLWADMLGIMFKAETRGTLTVNGRQIDSKALAKLVNDTKRNIEKYLKELEDNDVFSRLEDGTIISRRMYRESKKKERIKEIRSEAGKQGAKQRWQEEDTKAIANDMTNDMAKGMAKMAASTSTSTSTSSSKKKKKKKKNKNNSLFEKEFEQFWKAYPKKVAKDYAKEKFMILMREGEKENLRKAFNGYMDYLKMRKVKDNFEQEPLNPATFLMKNRWKDYIDFEYEPPL